MRYIWKRCTGNWPMQIKGYSSDKMHTFCERNLLFSIRFVAYRFLHSMTIVYLGRRAYFVSQFTLPESCRVIGTRNKWRMHVTFIERNERKGSCGVEMNTFFSRRIARNCTMHTVWREICFAQRRAMKRLMSFLGNRWGRDGRRRELIRARNQQLPEDKRKEKGRKEWTTNKDIHWMSKHSCSICSTHHARGCNCTKTHRPSNDEIKTIDRRRDTDRHKYTVRCSFSNVERNSKQKNIALLRLVATISREDWSLFS